MAKKSITKNQTLEKKQNDYKWYLLFMIIAFIFYGNSIKNGYSIDDELVTSTDVQKNELVDRGISGFVKIFRSRYANDGKQSYEYRPITTLSFAIEHSVVGESPNTAHISHFISVFLYGLCAIMLFLFLQQLFKGEAKWFSAFVVLLYLVHPIHTEIVDNIKTRDELLAMLFCLGSAIYIFKFYDRHKLKYLIFALILFGLGFLSRPSAKVFFGLIPLSLYFFRDIKLKNLLVVFFGIFVFQFLIKFFSKAAIIGTSIRNYEYFENPLYHLGLSYRIPMFFYSIIKYIEMLFIPYPLKYYYGYNEIPLIGYTDWQFFVGIVVVMILLYLIWKGLKKKKVFSYALLFFFFGIGGVANIIMPAAGIIAERFANLASIGFVLCLALAFFKWQKWNILAPIPSNKRTFAYSIFAIIAIPCLIYTTSRNNDWNSKIGLYKADMSKLTNSAKANSLLATEYMFLAVNYQKTGNIALYNSVNEYADSANFYFKKSIEIYSEYASSWNNLAVIQFNFNNDYDKTIAYSKRAIKIDSVYIEGYFNLGNCYGKSVMLNEWLRRSFSDTSPSFSLSNDEMNKINSYINNSGIKKAIVSLMQIENMSNNLKNPNLPPNQIDGFIEFIKNVEKHEGDYLPKLNLSSYFEQLKEIDPANREVWISNLQGKTREYMVNQVYELIKKEVSSPLILQEIFASNVKAYTDSTYSTFNKLNTIDPKYVRQYSAIFDFSKQFNHYAKMIKWGDKFVKAFPNLPQGTAYMQIAYAYYAIQEKDSSLLYYSLTQKAFKDELRDIRNLDERNPSQNEQMRTLSNQISTIENFLNEAKAKGDSLFSK